MPLCSCCQQGMHDHFCCVQLGIDVVFPKNSRLLELAHVDAIPWHSTTHIKFVLLAVKLSCRVTLEI